MDKLIKYALLCSIFFTISCKTNSIKKTDRLFPFTETEMIQNKNLTGFLLEYALFDTTKIDFVSSVLCDRINLTYDSVFVKMETIIEDSSYYFFNYIKRDYPVFEYYGVFYFNEKNLDFFSVYSDEFRYNVDSFNEIVDEVIMTISDNYSIDTIFFSQKVNDYYIPKLFFFFTMKPQKCSSEYLRKILKFENKLQKLLDNYLLYKFPNQSIKVKPNLELRIE